MHDFSHSSVETRDRDALIEQKHAALSRIMEAWEDALVDGLEPDLIANAAMFAAFTELVTTYGEDAVATLAEGLPGRIRNHEFTVHRTTQ